MPPEAKDMHVTLDSGGALPLHDNEEEEHAKAQLSIIKNTQTETLKKMILVVSGGVKILIIRLMMPFLTIIKQIMWGKFKIRLVIYEICFGSYSS